MEDKVFPAICEIHTVNSSTLVAVGPILGTDLDTGELNELAVSARQAFDSLEATYLCVRFEETIIPTGILVGMLAAVHGKEVIRSLLDNCGSVGEMNDLMKIRSRSMLQK